MAGTRHGHLDNDVLAVLKEMKLKKWPIRMHEHLISAQTVHKFDGAAIFLLAFWDQ